MRGVYNLGLCNKIPAAQFRFLIGLILKGNSLGFKPVMEITNGEAMGIGGGNSRQSVNRLRKGLCKFRIDGKILLRVSHGNNLKNISAKYQIDYDLLCQNGSVWRGSKLLPSQIGDASSDASSDASDPVMMTQVVTDTVTSLRSDQKRGEQITAACKDLATLDNKEAIWVPPVDTAEDWIEYLMGIIKKPNQKYLKLEIQEKIKWLVANNDIVLLEECYEEFRQVPVARVNNRYAYFMKIIEDRGGHTP
jgi:hypothetical protein